MTDEHLVGAYTLELKIHHPEATISALEISRNRLSEADGLQILVDRKIDVSDVFSSAQEWLKQNGYSDLPFGVRKIEDGFRKIVRDAIEKITCSHKVAILKTVHVRGLEVRRYYVCRDCGAEFVYSIKMYRPGDI